jgi:osmoprotectant transport system permease protein
MKIYATLAILLQSFTFLFSTTAFATITIGSKAFTEGYLLSELLAQKIESQFHVRVARKFGMGATGVLFEALEKNDIQLYVEYTGTISEAILKNPDLHDFESIQKALSTLQLTMSPALGFNNTYAIAVTPEIAQKFNLRKISDLAPILSKIRPGFSHEFMARADGYPALAQAYGFHFETQPQSMEHTLAYEAIANHIVDLIDVYSTDAKIEKLHLQVLQDDRHFFPVYEAVILARNDFIIAHPDVWQELLALQNSIHEETMRRLNASVDIEKMSYADTIRNYLGRQSENTDSTLWVRTREHLFLVGVALLFSILAGVPLGIIAARTRVLGQGILLLSGLIQTIPSLALLCFLIPFFGIGVGSALIALCLYGLLPVVMNTFIGIRSIDPALSEMSHALGLTAWQNLLRIQLPLAARSILAGIRTSAIIGIGTATLAALIGAGGYGATIIAGLSMNDHQMILLGAIPAALLALFAHAFFELLNKITVVIVKISGMLGFQAGDDLDHAGNRFFNRRGSVLAAHFGFYPTRVQNN